MDCLLKTFELFETNECQAWTLAALSCAVGFVAALILAKIVCACRSTCACSNAAKKGGAKQGRKDDRPFEKRKPHPAPADGSVEIYVGNLSYDMTEEQLRQEFAAFGTVSHVRLVTNRANGKSKGFGFVQMPNRAEAEKACASLNDREIQGRKIKCNEAKNLI